MNRSHYIQQGRCSLCLRRAERSRSGAWWHQGGHSCGDPDAEFEPLEEDSAERQETTAPRDRQIRHPGRDR
ncbi:hypothetical protein ACIP96_06380 [Streptomyces nigra]|uniref:hypothetical protein n=1 Tax=Streptomyces nigra TaxID=1827580 RepID=UPI0037F63460